MFLYPTSTVLIENSLKSEVLIFKWEMDLKLIRVCTVLIFPFRFLRAVKTPSLEFHTPLDARLSVNGFETNAERILLNIHPYTADQTDCIADTSRFQVLVSRLINLFLWNAS